MSKTNRREFLVNTGTFFAATTKPPDLGSIGRTFLTGSRDTRLILHWYIFGPAWTAREAGRQLELMHEQHVGGVLIFPTYPIAVDDASRGAHNQNYLSPEFFEVLNSVVAQAHRLEMTVDIVLGTGWPFGGPSVTPADGARMLQRAPFPYTLKPGEEMVATLGDFVYYSAPTNMQVKRAAAGAEGLVIDHYNAEALRRYLDAVGRKLVEGVPKGSYRALFCDSLECYHANWTRGFPQIFQARRGYDLIPHLAALFDISHPDLPDLRCDFWRTLSEQAVDGFLKPLGEWIRSRGLRAMVEAYGTPPVNLSGYQYVDIPTGEHYEWKEFNSSRWASSGGHLAGKPVIMAEAWTWLGMPDRFADSLEQLKLCSDLHFLSGINALYGVTYAYSPVELGSPGWPPYFGPVTNHTQPFWPYFSYLADYIQRASYILQQGKPVADVLLYLPAEDSMAENGIEQLLLNWATRDRMASNGAPPEFRLKNALHYEADVVKTMVTNGYSFDGIDTFVFNGSLRVENGRLRCGDGEYAVLVLPNLVGIDVASMEKIAEFVRQGGTVIATRRLPQKAFGMRNRDHNQARLAELVGRIFAPDGRGVLAHDEKQGFLQVLRRTPPDIHFVEPGPHVGFVHRKTAEMHLYFLANTSEHAWSSEATFRVGTMAAERWDLRTGEISTIPSQSVAGGTRVTVRLGPLESAVFAFSRRGGRPRSAPAPSSHGKSASPPLFLESDWKLHFDQVQIPPIQLDRLKSWTEISAIQFFSGCGTYETEFEITKPRRSHLILDLGEVREIAEVAVNGRTAGVLWMRPHQIEITSLVLPGKNHLRIQVCNLLINKVLGAGPIDYSAVYARYGKRFPPGDEWKEVPEPLPSGLLGPVKLIFR